MQYEFRGRTLEEAVRKAVGRQSSCQSDYLEAKARLFSVWAPPMFWGAWVPLIAIITADRVTAKSRISYRSVSQAKSIFDVEIKGGDDFIRDFGPGSSIVTVGKNVTHDVATQISIRCRSHLVGQNIDVRVN